MFMLINFYMYDKDKNQCFRLRLISQIKNMLISSSEIVISRDLDSL